MVKPQGLRLSTKYLLVLMPMVLALAVPGLSMIVYYETRSHEETLTTRIGNQAGRVAAAFARHDAYGNPKLARDFLASLAADRAFLCAEVQEETTASPVAAVPAPMGCNGESGEHQLTLAIDREGIYTLHVRFTDSELVEADNVRHSLTILVVVFSFLFATIAAAFGFRRIVTRPLERLLHAIRRNTETGERTPIEVTNSDEFGVVAAAYNDLLELELEREKALKISNQALRVSQDEFKRLNAGLEERVRARTAELRVRELALTHSEQRFKDFAQASSDWYWEMDKDLRFSYFSDRFTEVTGVDPSLLLGKTREETGVPNVDPDEWQRHLGALRDRRPFRNFIHPRQKPDGTTVWLSVNGVPYADHNGEFKGYRGTGNEITDLVEARREAESASRAKSDFLANMSHELRTPLNAILGYAGLLKEEAAERQDQHLREDLSKIENAGRQLLGMVNDILDISKIEANMMQVSLDHVDLKELIDETVDTVQPVVAQNGNTLRIDSVADLRTIVTDRQKLRQILLNLLSNAAKFTHSGEIHLLVRHDGNDELRFEVDDTGIGMTGNQLAKIFDPFVQGDSATSKNFGGTGLGLALCNQFTQLLGGRLDVQSTEGVGTRFVVIVPIRHADTLPALGEIA